MIRKYSKAQCNSDILENEDRNPNNRFKISCKKCSKMCSFFCVKYSDEAEGKYFGICCPSTERECLLIHIDECYGRNAASIIS